MKLVSFVVDVFLFGSVLILSENSFTTWQYWAIFVALIAISVKKRLDGRNDG